MRSFITFFFIGSTALVDPGHFFSLLIYSQSVELLGRVMSSSQDLYLNTGQHKHRINTIALSGIRTHDHCIRASEDSSCLRPLGHCDRLASEREKTIHALDRSATVIG
jgi:hypothetical protein